MDSTFTLTAPAAAGSPTAEQPIWFRNRFFGDPAWSSLRWLESAEPAQLRTLTPIVVYGPERSGKSLLATIIARRCLGTDAPAKNAILVQSLKDLDRRVRHGFVVDDDAGTMAMYEAPEVFVVEDAHEPRLNAAVDSALCGLIERRSEQKRLSIFCSRSAPWEGSFVSARLASRMVAGWIIKLDSPSKSLLESLLQEFEAHVGVRISDTARQWLVNTPQATVPELVSWLHATRQAHPYHTLLNKADFLASAAKKSHAPSVARSVALRQIARELGVDLAAMTSPSRRHSLVRARGVAIVILRDSFRLTWQQIAALMGRKDHSTVLHAYQKTVEALAHDRDLEHDLTRATRLIYRPQSSGTVDPASPAGRISSSGNRRTARPR